MTELIKLTPAEHGNLKVVTDSALGYASKSHVMSVRVTEIGKMAVSLPVFITKNQFNGRWNLSAVTSVTPRENLFVEDNQWLASYKPTSMQTYPFFLMQSDQDDKNYTIGIVPDSPDFSEQEGEAIFESDGKATLYLSQITKLLEVDIQNDIHTYQFLSKLDELGLIKQVDLLVQYKDGTMNTIQGLYTIDESVLNTLNGDQLVELNSKGYLSPIHSMLLSILQLNALIKRNNASNERKVVQQIKLESSKKATAV